MKKFNFIFAVLAAAVLASCTEKIGDPSDGGVRKSDYVAPVDGATFSIVASSAGESDPGNPQSKALFNGLQLVWYSGDALNVFANSENSYEFDFAPIEGADWKSQGNTFYTTEFTPEEGTEYAYTAVFPFVKGLTMDSDGWIYETVDGVTAKKTYTLETPTQKRTGDKAHLETMPLWGTATATGYTVPEITMHNAVSVIEVETLNSLSVAPMEVTKVKFSSDCIVFGGEYYLNAKTGKLELKEGTGKSEVELVCSNLANDGTTKTDMCKVGSVVLNEIAVAPQTVSGTLKVEVTTNQGTVIATRTLENLSFNAGRFRKLQLALDESLRNIFIKADADGEGDGSSWENAFNITQFLDYVKQNEDDSDNNAIKLDGRNFYFAGGTYAVSNRKVEFNNYAKSVEMNFYGGYDPSSTGTDISSRDISAYETVFDGAGTDKFLLLGNQTNLTFDGIVFANLYSNENSSGCIGLVAGDSGDANLNLTDCIFRKCTNDYKQYPVLWLQKGFARLSGVTFDGCRCGSDARGLIRLRNANSRVYLNSCVFVNNTYSGGFGLLGHINETGGNLCMYNVTFAGNDSGCGTQGVVNGTGGMLIASSTLAASNAGTVIRCESNPNSGSMAVNSLIIQEKDQKAIDMPSSGKKLTSLGGNIIVGSINALGEYVESTSDDIYSTVSDASALELSWTSGTHCYLWNGTTSFTKLTGEQVREAIRSYSNANTGQIKAGSTVVYDGAKAGEDFLGWLDSLGAFGYDAYGNARSTSAHWPGSYQAD